MMDEYDMLDMEMLRVQAQVENELESNGPKSKQLKKLNKQFDKLKDEMQDMKEEEAKLSELKLKYLQKGYDPKKDKGSDEPHYYGRRIFSRSVGFVFDVSGSMDKNITIPEGASTKLGDIPRSGTRMEIAREVLAGAIQKLKSKVKFNLVFFSTDVQPWKGGKMVPASPGNTKAAASAVRNKPADGETNIHGALKAILGLHDKSSLEANLDDIPDTVYFLTDGSPTAGQITSAPELLGWFENLNRFAKVRLYVVAFGNLGVDLDFLRGLAAAGGGELIHVPEK